MAFLAATGRAEGPIRMEVDPAAGEDAASRGAAAV
jgi:hypothetical protein